MNDLSIEGGCHCGDVRYRVRAKPGISHICHCRSCQKASAGPMIAWLDFSAEDFEWIRGEPSRYRYNHTGEEEAWAERYFCGRCGSYMAYVNDVRVKDGVVKWIDVTLCTLDDPDAFPPTSHSQLEDKPSWVKPWEL